MRILKNKKINENELSPRGPPRSGLAQNPAGIEAYENGQRGIFVYYDLGVIEQTTQELGYVRQQLGTTELSLVEQQQQGTRQDFSGQNSLVMTYTNGLQTFPKAQDETGIQAGPLLELPTKRGLLYSTQNEAGRIKVRAMDGLLLSESYSWMLINNALKFVKAEVKSAATDAAREQILTNWGPFLSLVSKELECS